MATTALAVYLVVLVLAILWLASRSNKNMSRHVWSFWARIITLACLAAAIACAAVSWWFAAGVYAIATLFWGAMGTSRAR